MPAVTARKPAPAKHGTCRWVGGNDRAREALLSGLAAELAVRLAGQDEWTAYLLEPRLAPAGLAGWRLVRYDEGGYAAYDLPADLSGCDCPDARHRARQGGCKHRRACRAALTRIGLLAAKE